MIYEIGWQIIGNNKNNNHYYWAEDLCKTFEERFKMKPEISGGSKYGYSYIFSFKEKDFYITELADGGASVRLAYKDEALDKKREESEKIIQKIKAKMVLP